MVDKQTIFILLIFIFAFIFTTSIILKLKETPNTQEQTSICDEIKKNESKFFIIYGDRVLMGNKKYSLFEIIINCELKNQNIEKT